MEKFKLVYSDWYMEHGQKKPFGNCIHPIVRDAVLIRAWPKLFVQLK
jgi:hypothetical protein